LTNQHPFDRQSEFVTALNFKVIRLRSIRNRVACRLDIDDDLSIVTQL
jgi:hypothetical protein